MKRGFALPAVLAITGVVCLALLAVAQAIDSLSRSAREAVAQDAFHQAALDLEAGAVFAALTRPVTSSAIVFTDDRGRSQTAALDGSPYLSEAGLLVSLQDESGLINLNTLPAAAIPRLITLLAVPDAEADRLAARMADYIDIDDSVRAGGAERLEYRRADLPPPPNGALRSRSELLGVLGLSAAAAPGAWQDVRRLVVADDYTAPTNVNTAPAEVLSVRYGLTLQQARRAVDRRRVRDFDSLEDLGRAAGVRLTGDFERSVTASGGRFRFTANRAAHAYNSRILLSPRDPVRPFQLEDRLASLLRPAEERKHAPDAVPPPVPWD